MISSDGVRHSPIVLRRPNFISQATIFFLIARSPHARLSRRRTCGTALEQGQLLADKGYDTNAFRAFLKANNIKAVIPRKSNRNKRTRRDKQAYKGRNVVEPAFAGSRTSDGSSHVTTNLPEISSRPYASSQHWPIGSDIIESEPSDVPCQAQRARLSSLHAHRREVG